MRLLNSSINEVKFDNSVIEGRGRHFVSRFIEAGLVSYEDQNAGVLKVSKEALDKFVYSLVGCPVIIKHQRVKNDNVDDIRVGVVSGVNFSPEDGWYWCEGVIWDAEAIKLIEQGWSVSCCFVMTESTGESGEWHNMPYDDELINGLFEHLAIVPNPRYEEATILLNSKKESNKMLNIFKRKRVQNAEKDEDVEWITVKGTHIPVKKGESKEEAISKFFKEKEKGANAEIIEKLEENRDKMPPSGLYGKLLDIAYSKENLTESELREKFGNYTQGEWADYIKGKEKSRHLEGEGFDEETSKKMLEETGISIASPEEFKKMFGMYPDEFEKAYPSKKEDIQWKRDGLGEKVVLKQGNKKIVVRKNGDVRWYKDGKLISELNQKTDKAEEFILHGVRKGYAIENEKVPSEDGNPMKSGVDSFSKLTNGEGNMADKRKAIREIMAIAAKPDSDFEGGEEEKIETIAKLLEKSEYAESEASDKKDNACSKKNEKEDSDEDSKENKCSNAEDDSKDESEKEDKDEEKKEEDKKENSDDSDKKEEVKENSKQSFDDLKRLSNTANAEQPKVYMSEADRLALGKSLY